jgi:hypothetical protein
MKTSGNNESNEKNANEAARLAHPWRRKDRVRSASKRQNDMSIGMISNWRSLIKTAALA